MSNPLEDANVKRLTDHISKSFADALAAPEVPPREAVKQVIQDYLKQVGEGPVPSGIEVVCDARNNRPSDIEQNKMNVILSVPSWIAEQMKQQYESDDLAWPTMPTHGPILAKYNEFIEKLQPFKASTVPGFDGSIGWFFASKTCSLYIDFLPNECVSVYWCIDQSEAPREWIGAKPLKHERLISSEANVASIIEFVKPAYDVVVQARANDDVMQAMAVLKPMPPCE